MARIEDILPLTPLQEGLLFHARAEEGAADAYTVQLSVRLKGPLDTDRLRTALDRVLQRYPNLRSAFRYRRSGEPVALVPDAVRLAVRERVAGDSTPSLEELARSERSEPFDLSRPPAIRCMVVEQATDDYVLLLTCHHILLDGWSMPLLLDELGSAYSAVRDGRDLPEPVRFSDYLDWRSAQDDEAARRAWNVALDGLEEPLLLALDVRPGAAQRTSRRLDTHTSEALVAVARSAGVTVNTVCECAFALLIGRMTGRDDVVFGTTVSGRPPELAGSDQMLGLLINTVPVRIRLPAKASVNDMLKQVQHEQSRLIEHHYLGLADIQSALGMGELFDSIFTFQSYPTPDEQTAWDDNLHIVDVEGVDANHYPVSVTVAPGDEFELGLVHRIDPEQAERLLNRFASVLSAIGRDAGQAVDAIDVLTARERNNLLVDWVEGTHRSSSPFANPVPIGQPIPGVRAYVLGSGARLLPPGAVGELYLAGNGLARGYAGHPGVTAERFLPDPFGKPGSRLYRTGDRARWREDGQLEYVGRIDSQVKIRGFRVELGEIESVLARFPAVESAAVIVREDVPGDHRIVAYVVLASDGPSPDEIYTHLRGELPAYMLPAAIVPLAGLPLLLSGKIDRRALPAPESLAGPAPEAPALTETEQSVADVWHEVLGVDSIGPDDNFFDLGGHSLLAVRLIERLAADFKIQLSASVLYAAPTPAGIARLIEAEDGGPGALVPMRKNNEGGPPHLILVHPIGGSTFCYADIARALPADCSVHGLDAPGLAAGTKPIDSVADLAAHYVAELVGAGLHRNCVLAGWSMGGAIAYEMSERIRRVIGAAPPVVLIDTHLQLGVDANATDAELVSMFAEDWARAAGRAITPQAAELAGLTLSAQLVLLADRARAAGALGPDAPLSSLERRFEVFKAHAFALVGHRPHEHHQGRVRLLAASESVQQDPSHGWSTLTVSDFDVREVSGDHYGLLAAPALVDALTESLDWVRR